MNFGIRDDIIICSKKCSEEAEGNDPDNIIDNLKQKINELKVELEEKTRYIKRLKKHSTSMVEEAANI